MNDSKEIKIAIAAHKPYWMPEDSIYLPVQAGSFGKPEIEGYWRDDTGDNISEKNSRYSELTALYWAWKNVDADYLGLAHYRRHFAGAEKNVLSKSDAQVLLNDASVVVPKKRHYYIETVGNHYSHTFSKEHLDITRDVLSASSPEILSFFDAHMKERSAHIWNMLIMDKGTLDLWCSWLFPTLREIEGSINFDGMTPFEERVIGRLSERLFDPWLNANKIKYVEAPVKELEKSSFSKKAMMYFLAKYAGKKYQGSF